jgi:peroxiredoxin
MTLTKPPICNFGWEAPNFLLLGVDEKKYALADVMGPKGALIVFMCNHCPYVRGVIGRLVDEVREIQALGIGVAAIMPNDTSAYPQDSFENMKAFASENDFSFPYLLDETQEIARAYDAVCTPDFFGFNGAGELQYRGRLDASKTNLVPDAERELYLAMAQVANTGNGPKEQIPSMGCSIKWRSAA